jgi:hypothetical protein
MARALVSLALTAVCLVGMTAVASAQPAPATMAPPPAPTPAPVAPPPPVSVPLPPVSAPAPAVVVSAPVVAAPVVVPSPPAHPAAAVSLMGPAPVVAVVAPAVTPKAEVPESQGPSDHEAVVGRIGVGYFGISQLPVGETGGTGVTEGTVNAPVVGIRYWFQNHFGLDAGIGFGYLTASQTTTNNGTATAASAPSSWGFALHAGLPIALAYSKHFTFEAVPEITLGFAGGSLSSASVGPGSATSESVTGFLLDAGARVGAEIHFGFIGIPQLALEGSIGLYVRHESYGATVGTANTSTQSTGIATSVGSAPWAIFTDNISALYYF